ncbi:transposase domain-containing protein [Lysinibacillus sp. M3]|uniref:Transposase domain-containing protein n=1 Tax=Lysinibacillus zambalensis TaxID=3160866 RepID=A0ABV1MWW3_9BACI
MVEKFLKWVDESPFFGKNALAKVAEYTLNRTWNNPAENAIRPNVIGRKNWLFSVIEAGVKANAICLSLAETAKANGIDFYQYLVTLMTELPNLPIHQQPEILNNYMPWSKNPSHMYKLAIYPKKIRIDGHSSCVPKRCAFFIFWAYSISEKL